MKTIIAEKPSVAREIARIVGATKREEGYFEGGGYAVTWAFGHLVQLAMPDGYGIRGFVRDNLPVIPDTFTLVSRQVKTEKGYKPDSSVVAQIKTVARLFKESEQIIVTTDAGREGELIFRYLYHYTGCTTPFVRLWISSLTDKAIREGLRNLEAGDKYDNLYLAAKARSESDWLVGINGTQALSIAAGHGTYSVGRVQTPTLAMVCARYWENRRFTPEAFWQLHIATDGCDEGTVKFSSSEKWKEKESATELYNKVKSAGKPFVKVKLGGGTFYFRPQNNVVLEAGSRYKYTVKVNTTGLTLEGCTIGNWADGGGESGAAEDLGYIYDSNTNTYTVYNANGLMNVAELVNGGKTDINITLTADIDLTGKDWTPIGTSNRYSGTFDGGGHTITGLTFTTNDVYAGLFGHLNSAGTVKNVVMEGVQITSNQIYGGSIGGVVGYSWGTIENCSVSGSVSGTVYVGGVVGAQIGGSITGCSSSATVKGTVDVGGVAGQTNSSATLTACYATGNVIIEMAPKKNIAGGGLVGMNAGSSLLACYATGNVTSTGSSTGYMHIGGFLGNNYTTVTACYWKNNHEQGIGYNRESTGATKVDGSVVTWQKAVDVMNTALQNAGSEWRYELKGALPTLRKQ